MIDEIMKTIIRNELSQFNTTMQCKVITTSPIVIQPISEGEPYPLIGSARRLKEWGIVEGGLVEFNIPLNINDTVLVAFNKRDLADAVIVGVVK